MRMGRMKRGFTLVETVVTVGIIGALAAVVYPTVVKQFDSADPTKAAEDLGNLSTAIETFGVNVRPNQPQDIEDLINPISSTTGTAANDDSTAKGAVYSATDVLNWKGPYVALSVPITTNFVNGTVFTSGFGATVNNRLKLFDIDAVTLTGGDTVDASPGTAADFVAVNLQGLSGAAFNAINLLIDGPNENSAALRRNAGRFRCPYTGSPTDATACSEAYYLASPFRQ